MSDILFLVPVITISTLICKLYPYEDQKNKRRIIVTAFVVISVVAFGAWIVYSEGIFKSLLNISVTGIDFIDGLLSFLLVVFICVILSVFLGIFTKIEGDKGIAFALSVMANVKYSGGKYSDCNLKVFRKIYSTVEKDVQKPFDSSPAAAMCELELAELIITVKPAILKRFYNLSANVQTSILLMRSINSKEKDELDYSCYAKHNPSKRIYDHYIDECFDYCNKNISKSDKFTNYLISETKDKSSQKTNNRRMEDRV